MTTTTAPVRTYSSQDVDIDRTIRNLARANARGVAKGLKGGFEYSTRIETRDGEKVTLLEITGTPLSYGGWSFLAKIERVGESFTTATSPWAVEEVDRSLVKPGECDHCGHNRQRNLTFLVKHVRGRVMNVGSTCMRDFLGVDFGASWLVDDLESEIEYHGGSGERAWSVEHILTLAVQATKVSGGFVPTSMPGATRDRITSVLFARTAKELAAAREITSQEVADDEVANILAWLDAQDDSNSNYIANLKVIVAADYVVWNQIGILASLPNAYARSKQERIEREVKEATQAESTWLGEEGQKKFETTGTVVVVRNCGSYSYSGPDSFLYIWVTEEGNKIKTFSTSSTFAEVEEGDTITVTGTIKKHEEYKGEKVTVMTRCKVIA